MTHFFRRLRYLINRRRFDEELANDLEFHREMAAREGGLPLGNALLLREEARDAWGWTWIERLSQDLRYAVRILRKSPGFTLAAVLVLAIGIGVNIAAFSFFNLMVFKPLPVRDPQTLLRFGRRAPQNYASVLPYPEMAFFREHSRTLSAVVALSRGGLTVEGEAKPINADFATANLFAELGGVPVSGRFFDPARDDTAGDEPVVVLGYGFWQRHYGGDVSVIGKTLVANGKPAVVIGVAPLDFAGLSMEAPDLWAPLAKQPWFYPGSHLLDDFAVESPGVRMWGRLQPGLTHLAAEAELKSLAAELRKAHPNQIWENESVPGRPGYAKNLGGSHHGTGTEPADEVVPVAALVGALTLLILIVACTNLGSLLLARGVTREREISIRVAIGAGRARLVRQLFTESVLLGLLGSVAGMATGYVALRIMLVRADAPAWLNPAPDWRVVFFAAGTAFAAALLFGLTPALQAVGKKRPSSLPRQILIGSQVAGSCVLLILAGLLVKALDRAISAHPGFEYQQVVSIKPGLNNHGFSPSASRAWFAALESRLRGLPGVDAVSMSWVPPLENMTVTVGLQIDGRAIDIHVNHVEPEFFRAMSIPLLRGRNLMPGEQHAAIVSASLARVLWAGQDPLGKRLEIESGTGYSVVGVTADAHLVQRQDAEAVEAYFPMEESKLPSTMLVMKTSGTPEDLLPFVSSISRSIDPRVIPGIQLLKSSFGLTARAAETGAAAASVLGFTALFLACLGIAGLVSYAVSQRTREIGIRMALGARAGHVLPVVLGQLSLPVAAGLAFGVGGAAALSRVLRRNLYGVSHLDPVAYLGAIGVFAIVVGLAAVIPARRALRIDPMKALRQD